MISFRCKRLKMATPSNHRVKQSATPVTALALACDKSDTGPGSARSALDLAAAYPGRLPDTREHGA